MNASPLVSVILALCISGCAWGKWRGYEGGASQEWPVSTGAFVDRSMAVPVYYGHPPRRYEVIGYVDATTAPIRRSGVVAFAARKARENGADAIIVVSEGSRYMGSYSVGTGSGTVFHRGSVDRYGNVQGISSGSGVVSTTTVPLIQGRAEVMAIRWR